MVRNIVVLGGSSHPDLTASICSHLGIPPAKALLGKFAVGETRVEIQESVRGKDVFIVQSGGGKSDIPYNKPGAPLVRGGVAQRGGYYAIDSRPQTPLLGPHDNKDLVNGDKLHRQLGKLQLGQGTNGVSNGHRSTLSGDKHSEKNGSPVKADYFGTSDERKKVPLFEPQRGYRQWVAQSGKLVADLLTSAGADHVITMDLHDPQYQGFFDIPVDNLYGRNLLSRYIERHIENFRNAVIVSPDAGGAKRATAIADSFRMPFALIHKERRPTQFSEKQNASMMLVGDVANKTVILIDDMADTCTTVARAAKLLKKEGATLIYALVTHGILSGDAIERVKASPIDKLVVTNSVDQKEHKELLGNKLDVLEIGSVFAEAIRRVHHGESISVLFQHN